MRGDAGPIGLHEDIGACHHVAQGSKVARVPKIELALQLVAIGVELVGDEVRRFRMFDARDLCAGFGQETSAGGACQHTREIDDMHILHRCQRF